MCSCNQRRAAVAPALRPAARQRTPAPAPAPAPAVAPEPVYPPIELATVDTSVWGAALWRVLHTATVLARTPAHTSQLRALFAALTTGLPCPECSAHYNTWYSRNPIHVGMFGNIYRTILNWVLSLHNAVNRRNGGGAWKPEQVQANYRDLDKAKAALASLQGVIGDEAYRVASALLEAL